jgi:hypothetical protein
VPKELQSILKTIDLNAKMLKATEEINIEVKIEECSMNEKLKKLFSKCNNKRNQQKK